MPIVFVEPYMKALPAHWSAYLDQQHRYPSGLVGQFIAEKMLRQHAPETEWTVGLLQLEPTDRVLEIGFGAGRGLALALTQANQGSVTGVDLSPTMIQVAARRNRTAIAHRQLTLLRGNVATLPFALPLFDKLFSIHTFYFWPEPHEVCQGLVRLLAPGGRLVCTFATARQLASGEWSYWDVHDLAQALVTEFEDYPTLQAALHFGPNSRYSVPTRLVKRGIL
jgi:ubiquinone/menaquinone biosynthesis C-methylase UbiE